MTIHHSIASQVHLSKPTFKKEENLLLEEVSYQLIILEAAYFYLEVNIWWIWCVIANWRIKCIFNKEAIWGLSSINRN